MHTRLILAGAILATLAATKAEAELLDQRVEGLERICTYRTSTVGTDVRTHNVGLGDPCPAHLPMVTSDSSPPMTARLTSQDIQGDRRVCAYSQGTGSWNVRMPISMLCPLSAGMALKQTAPLENDDD